MDEITETKYSATKLSKITGIPVPTLSTWQGNGSIPLFSKEDLLADAIKAVVNHLRSEFSRARKGATGAKNLNDAKLKLVEAQTHKLEMENRIRQGELIEVIDVEKVWAAAFVAVRNGMLAIPSKLAIILANADDPIRIESLLKQEITEALTELSRLEYAEDEEDELIQENDGAA